MDFHTLIKDKKMRLKNCTTVVTDNQGIKYKIVNGKKIVLGKTLPFVIDTKPDLHVARVLSGLYLSSQDPANTIEILREYNIKHILNVGVDTTLRFDGINHYHFNLLDLPESNIYDTVKPCIRIIHEKRHENILVHCNAGISRAPSIVISYLMALKGLTYNEAYNIVKTVRPLIKPNEGFVRQLQTMDLSNLNLIDEKTF